MKPTSPPPAGLAILRELVAHVKKHRVVASRPETFIGYKDIHDALGLALRAETYGDSLSRQGLAELADWTLSSGHPAITGLVVDRSNYTPGKGYFELFGKRPNDFQWWENEISRSLDYDWDRFLGLSPQPVAPSVTQVASDLPQPPEERVATTTYRILRDTELARRVKSVHQFECQICGRTIELRDGSRYAEAHHIQPLGSPHNGPDIIGNILCLCPNHHAELDYGVIALTLSALRLSDAHAIDEQYLEYHNRNIHTP